MRSWDCSASRPRARPRRKLPRTQRGRVRCALAMREQLRALNAVWAAQGLLAVAMRVGIYTGPLVAGSLGGRQRLEYTVLGDTVNIVAPGEP